MPKTWCNHIVSQFVIPHTCLLGDHHHHLNKHYQDFCTIRHNQALTPDSGVSNVLWKFMYPFKEKVARMLIAPSSLTAIRLDPSLTVRFLLVVSSCRSSAKGTKIFVQCHFNCMDTSTPVFPSSVRNRLWRGCLRELRLAQQHVSCTLLHSCSLTNHRCDTSPNHMMCMILVRHEEHSCPE